MYQHRKQLFLKQLQYPERQKKKYWKKMTLLRKALNDLEKLEEVTLDDVVEVNNMWMLTRRTTHLRPSEEKELSEFFQKGRERKKQNTIPFD